MKKDGIEKYCKYCENASTLSDGDVMLCGRFGIVKASHKCRRFRYDPMKRIPRRIEEEPKLEFVDVDGESKETADDVDEERKAQVDEAEAAIREELANPT